MGFQYICVCILIYLSGITLNKITDIMLYNEMHLCICPKIKDLLCNQLSTINIVNNTINNNFLIYNTIILVHIVCPLIIFYRFF